MLFPDPKSASEASSAEATARAFRSQSLWVASSFVFINTPLHTSVSGVLCIYSQEVRTV